MNIGEPTRITTITPRHEPVPAKPVRQEPLPERQPSRQPDREPARV